MRVVDSIALLALAVSRVDSLTLAPGLRPHATHLSLSSLAPRVPVAPVLAYNPAGTGKARPKKKKKSKAPKEKVKAPPTVAGVTGLAPELTFFYGAPSASETVM